MDPSSIKYYDQNASRLVPEYHSAEVSGIHTLLGKWLPKGGDVLEIGCGAGRDAAYMASMGCKVVATDASESMVSYSHGYFQKLGISDGIALHQAAFPLPPSHNLLSDRFDAVVSMAVLMHIPNSELFEFAIQVRTILKFKGIFVCSFCNSREPTDDDTRLFVSRETSEVQLFFERIGFHLLFSGSNEDGLGRDIKWHTLIFESEGNLAIRPVDQIEAIILRWADLVHDFSSKSIPTTTILTQLLVSPAVKRDVNVAKSVFSHLDSLNCVWSNRNLSKRRYDVDQIILIPSGSRMSLAELFLVSLLQQVIGNFKPSMRFLKQLRLFRFIEALRGGEVLLFRLESNSFPPF
ncbi:MAG: class I SAM-dependent methyltransferase [Bacteroidota bacterium]|nr:class I SAM-dependent methyltransferase [Bacteroidota bacterium]